jgi:hypothetical protein
MAVLWFPSSVIYNIYVFTSPSHCNCYVQPSRQETKSISYDVTSIPDVLRTKTAGSLGRLLEQAERDSHKPQSYTLAVGGTLKTPPEIHAKRIKFGFKAPVAMTLAPWWAHLLPDFRLLHVLRDGRDIAFSANQGPVQKFYHTMYGANSNERIEVKAIRLWSDWNAGLREWAEAMSKKVMCCIWNQWWVLGTMTNSDIRDDICNITIFWGSMAYFISIILFELGSVWFYLSWHMIVCNYCTSCNFWLTVYCICICALDCMYLHARFPIVWFAY